MDWYKMTSGKVLEMLDTGGLEGLDGDEAKARAVKYGANELSETGTWGYRFAGGW